MESLQELLVEELNDLYDAEQQLVEILPKIAGSAIDENLREAMQDHLEVTQGQVKRLEQVFRELDEKPSRGKCAGMKGLLEEAQQMVQELSDSPEVLLDCAIAGAAQRVEHYEIAAYTTASAMAEAAGFTKAAKLLEDTLREEQETDRRLSLITTDLLEEAAQGDTEEDIVDEESDLADLEEVEQDEDEQEQEDQIESQDQVERTGRKATSKTRA